MNENINTTTTATDVDTNTETTIDTQNTGAAEKTTYSKEEVEALLQREADRRVTAALKKVERQTAAKVKEAEKLAAMNESEKYEYQLKQREAAIAEKEAALALAENKNEASKILAEKGISLTLVDFVVAEEAETMMANIELLDKAFKASVKAEVEKRLASNTPKKNLPVNEQLTAETFKKMSIAQMQDLYNNNPELYKTLTNQN